MTDKPKSTQRPEDMKETLDKRLKRIEGQVRGIQKMVQENVYCDDILTQISAIQSAINGVSTLLLDYHIHHCVLDRMKSGDEEIVDEFLNTIKRALRNK